MVEYDVGGGRIVVMRRTHAPLVTLAVFRRGGVLAEGPGTAGTTALLMRASLKATADRTAERIALESERLGGVVSASAGPDLVSWSLTVPSERFAEGWSLLSDVAFRPAFPEAEVEKERAVLLADLDRLRDDMYRYPLRLLLRAAFGDHPYGLAPEQAEAALAGAGPAALREWHTRRLEAPWAFAVGDVSAGKAAEAMAGALQRLATNPKRLVQAEPPDWPEGSRREEVRRDRAQTAIALGFPGPARNDPDRLVLDVLSAAVSGLGNRLFEELRSRRSLAYTVAAYPLARVQAGAFVGYIATSPDRAAEARDALVREMLRLRTGPPPDEELERARRYLIGSRQIRTQTNAARLAELAAALLAGEGLTEIREYEARVRAVTPEAVREAAERWLEEERLVEGVVRGA